MNSSPYFKISANGTVNVLPAPPPRTGCKFDYSKKPVQVSIRQSPLGLEIHGENFSTSITLDTDDALSVILMLTYGVRELLYTPVPREFVTAAV